MGPLFTPREGCEKWGPEETGTLAGPGAEPSHPGPQDRPLLRGARGQMVGLCPVAGRRVGLIHHQVGAQ